MEPSTRSRSLSILLVEDEGDISEPLGDVLRDEGHEVTLATDGAVALERVESGGWDVIVLDVRLPKVDGLTVARRAREVAPAAHVILMSAYGSLPEAERFPEGVAYFPKPFDLDDFLSAISQIALD